MRKVPAICPQNSPSTVPATLLHTHQNLIYATIGMTCRLMIVLQTRCLSETWLRMQLGKSLIYEVITCTANQRQAQLCQDCSSCQLHRENVSAGKTLQHGMIK